MAALTLTPAEYRQRVLGGWQGKSAGVTLGAGLRGHLTPGRNNYYSPVPGQPAASVALDFPLVWLTALEESGPDIAPADLAVAWLEHLDYSQDELGYGALNLRRGLPPPASGSFSNWFRHSTGGVMRADLWAMLAPGAPQVAAAYAYHDSKLDHSEEGIWAAMFLAAVGSACFFLHDTITLLTIGLAMIPRTCRTARGVKTAIAAAQRGASWLEARESVQHEVGHKNFSDSPQNMGFLTIGLLYGGKEFGPSLCAGVNCGYDAEVVGGALGALLGIQCSALGLPADWTRPIGDLFIPGLGVRDLDAPTSISAVAERTALLGEAVVAARCPDVAIAEAEPAAALPNPAPPDGSARMSPILPDEPADITQPALSAEAAPTVPTDTPTALPYSPVSTDGDDIDLISDEAAERSLNAAAPGSVITAQEPAYQPAAAPVAPSMPGVFTPQAVSREEPEPIGSTTVTAAGFPAPSIAADPVGAIAWADSTLVKPLLVTPPNGLIGEAGAFDVALDTGDSPAVAYNVPKTLSISVVNRGSEVFSGRVSLLAPPGWQISAPNNLGQRQFIAAHTGTLRVDFTLLVPENQGRIDIANTVSLRFAPDNGAAPFETEFVLMGASCWWTVGPFANFDGEGFDRSYMPEDRPGLTETYVSRTMQTVRWEKHSFFDLALDLEPVFRGSSGVCYGRTILRSPTARDVRLVPNTNTGVKLWLNGALLLRRNHRETFRPQLGAGPWAVDATLAAGDNPVMLKWIRGAEPYEFSLTVSDRAGRGLPEVGNTRW